MVYGKRSNNNSIYAEKIPFNNALGKLERLGEWWAKAFEFKIDGLTEFYFNCLETIFIEIYAHLSEEEKKEIKLKVKEIEGFLDKSGVPQTFGMEKVLTLNRRNGSNKCDLLAMRLNELCKKYNLEWFDIMKWSKEQRESEPVMRG